MIYRFTLFLFTLLAAFDLFSQPGNLIENPSFEFRPECDDNNGPLEEAPPWFNPTGATPDVFHECAIQVQDPCPYPEQLYLDPWAFGIPTNFVGCQPPRTGSGYSGFLAYWHTDYREYLAIPLSQTLVEGVTYLVRFYVSLADRSYYGMHALQAYFSEDSLLSSSAQYLDIEPQLTNMDQNFIVDKENWTELSWEYTAEGDENFLYIGNFQSNAEIDTIVAVPEGVSPEDHYPSYYYVDDVYVGTDILSSKDKKVLEEFKLWPNPATDEIFVNSSYPIKNIKIYNVLGELLKSKVLHLSEQDRIDLNHWGSGIYIVEIESANGRATKKFVKR